MKQIIITEDLYNKLLNSNPIMETKRTPLRTIKNRVIYKIT